MKFYTVELLLSESFKDFEELYDFTEEKENGEVYDDEIGDYVEIDCDITKEVTRLWTLVNLEKDPFTQSVMTNMLEYQGWYDPCLF